jgi:hypothetical protein
MRKTSSSFPDYYITTAVLSSLNIAGVRPEQHKCHNYGPSVVGDSWQCRQSRRKRGIELEQHEYRRPDPQYVSAIPPRVFSTVP